MPLSQVLDGPRPGPADLGLDRLWRELRREVADATVDGPFDLRRALFMSNAERESWEALRYRFLAGHFRDDRRVACER